MQQYISILKSSFLFEHCDDSAILSIVKCLDGHTRQYQKDEIIYNFYDTIEYAGIVLTGEVHAIMINRSDNEFVLCNYNPGSLFGSAYSCIPSEPSNIAITVQKDCTILFLKLSNLFLEKAVHCPFASRATANLLKETAQQNIFQTRKVQILTQKHIRDRFLLYLSTLSAQNQSDTGQVIYLPFNRQELANYLGVERSALSREMCRMKEEGFLDFYRNKIVLRRNIANLMLPEN